ncbi:hypothetical protein [Janthinobacterium sp.]|uniref:hypothetical protein n=1 Tax=Janthinobacterium sp. TaxID=1871054 RepID=UPI0025BBF910|nr:hypothetical protein [Janthinobacterium sp.]NBV19957.1 hypothetical protein [Janthinobacterium sp.]
MDVNSDLATTPAPPDPSDAARATHTRLRRRLLYSCHEQDVLRLLQERLGVERARAYGRPDLTANAYLGLWSQLAVMYNAEPDVLAPPASSALVSMVADLGFWPFMQRVQRDTLGLREMGVRLDIDEESGTITFRPVYPDMVSAECDPRRPSVPVRIREWVEHCGEFYLHDCNIRGTPYYTVTNKAGKDVTTEIVGGPYTGKAYPYRDATGAAILPYVLYHAAETGCLFDPYTLREVVEGSLNVCVLLTFYGHVVQNAAWAQRYAIGIVPHGQRTSGPEDARRTEVTADPATVFMADVAEGTTTPMIGQWSSPIDPEALLRSIMVYERRLHMLANVQPADVTRQEADVRSGYSLAVSRESVREAQSVYEPQFRRGDQQVFRVAACLLNRHTGSRYPETAADYRITYKGLPKAPGELDAEAKAIQTEQDAGRIGPITAYRRRYPGTTEVEALVKLADASTEREQLDAQIAATRQAAGLEVPVQTVAIDAGKAQSMQALITSTAAGQIPADTAKAMLIAVYGLPEPAAEAIVEPMREAEAETPDAPDPMDGAGEAEQPTGGPEVNDNSTDGPPEDNPADGPEDNAENDA